MSDKTMLMKAFNTHFFDFMNDIIRVFPENENIIVAKKSFEMVKRANPTSIIKVWYSHIYLKYADVIDAGNVDFFFDKDYSEDLATMANSKEIMKIIDNIREPLRNTSDVNKEHSVEYIKNLTKIAKAYAGI